MKRHARYSRTIDPLLIMLMTVLFLIITFFAFGQKADVATKMAMGDTYAKQGNGGKAISNYEDAAALDPKDPLPHFKIGNIYLQSKNADAAMEEFQKAITVDPGFAPAYKEIAELYYLQKKGIEAVKAQQKFIELSDSRDEGLVRLAYYQFMARDFAGTNETFEQAHQKGLLKDSDLRYYGLSLVEAADYEKAQKILEEYLSKAEGVASDYAAYGKVLIQLRQDSLAAIALDRSLALDNRQTPVKKMLWETLYNLGKSYYSNKQFALADTTFGRLIDLHPGVATGYLWAGRSEAQLDPETTQGLAKDSYEKVIEISKSNTDLKEAYSYLGYYYYIQKDAASSRANWQKVLSIDPQDTQAKEALKAIRN